LNSKLHTPRCTSTKFKFIWYLNRRSSWARKSM